MKFNQLSTFLKHLEKAKPDHLAEVYLLIDPEPYMQKKLALKVALPKEELILISAETLTLKKFYEVLETSSLFFESKCCILLGIEKLPKKLQDALFKAIQNPTPHIRLVLTASQSSALCQKMAKIALTLDLSFEKPWDRDQRLLESVVFKLKKDHLFISNKLAAEVVKMSGGQVALIDQEVEKLICYLKDQKEVTREDLDILQPNFQYSIFKVGEALLENNLQEALLIGHTQNFPALLLIYTLRSLFQRALRLKEIDPKDRLTFFPTLKGRLLEKNLEMISKITSSSLKKALLILFDLEVLMKNQKISEDLLKSHLLLKLGALHEPLSA